MSHMRIWLGRDGALYFAGKIVAEEADILEPFNLGTSRPVDAALQAEWLMQAFQVVASREEAQNRDRPNRRDRP